MRDTDHLRPGGPGASMAGAGSKRCVVVWALHERQRQWTVELPLGASIRDALEAARRQAGDEDVPWETAETGIYGEPHPRDSVPRDGDRIELYRPLPVDPREGRRARVQKLRRAQRR